MRRKSSAVLTLTILLLTILTAAMISTAWAADGETPDSKGLILSPCSFGGAYIYAPEAGLETGKAYTVEYNVYSTGTSSYRVRYADNDGSSGSFKHNDESGAHSAPSAIANGATASQVPAYFEDAVLPYETKVLTVNFTFGKNISGLDPLSMDYIGFFGGRGGADYQVLGMRLKDASGKVIAVIGDMTAVGDAEDPSDREYHGVYNNKNFFTLMKEGTTQYQLHRPAEPEKGKKYPVMIWLHGSGVHSIVESYPNKGNVGYIEDFINLVNNNQDTYESYVVMVVSPEWGPKPQAVKSIIDRLIKDESVDTDRIYIYGFSMGGFTTSDFIMAYPDVAAAAILICGASDLSPATAKKLVNLPIRLYHSDDDEVVSVERSRNFVKAMTAAGANKTEYFESTGYGHNAWNHAFKSGIAEWMFAQLKKQPAPIPEPVYPDKAAARPSQQTFTVDGKTMDVDRYNINGSNYFKLRDLAYLLNGTGAQFQVGYENGTVTITTGKPYAPIGTEMGGKGKAEMPATFSKDTVMLNGKLVTIAAYKINGANYFQLRALGEALGFGVDYDAATNTAAVTTK